MEPAFSSDERITAVQPVVGRGPIRSLVVVWQSSTDALDRRLAAWSGAVRSGLDVVIVHACSSAERQRLERRHPGVRILVAPADCGVRVLRQLGVSAARGDIVEVRDDVNAS